MGSPPTFSTEPYQGDPVHSKACPFTVATKKSSRFAQLSSLRVDAVSKLQEHIPDIMLLDIEMPRMDGFELATHVRNEPRLRDIPIIMITSRTGDKHRQRAMQIGVNRYLGKPFQETDLLENIQALLEEAGLDDR